MTMRTVKLHLAFVLLVVGYSPTQQLSASDVLISNPLSQPVTFATSCNNRRDWSPGKLEANSSKRFACPTINDTIWIHIGTDLPNQRHQQVEYTLDREKRYEFYWNIEKRRWDLRPIKPRT